MRDAPSLGFRQLVRLSGLHPENACNAQHQSGPANAAFRLKSNELSVNKTAANEAKYGKSSCRLPAQIGLNGMVELTNGKAARSLFPRTRLERLG
jgi:hypothetical protein